MHNDIYRHSGPHRRSLAVQIATVAAPPTRLAICANGIESKRRAALRLPTNTHEGLDNMIFKNGMRPVHPGEVFRHLAGLKFGVGPNVSRVARAENRGGMATSKLKGKSRRAKR